MDQLLTLENLLALITLTAMELVLGIDNIVFISVLVAKLPKQNQTKARALGISLALVFRILLLFSLTWVMKLNSVLFSVFGIDLTGKSLILIGGGLFLVTKSTTEIKDQLHETKSQKADERHPSKSFSGSVIQIVIIDIIFSIDSVVTAVGMAQALAVMIVAVVLSVGAMFAMSIVIGNFVERNPTIKMLALAFLILIGVSLVIDGTGGHLPKAYIYFAMGFALVVELINLRIRKSPK